MLAISTIVALSAWLSFIWIVDPDGFRARSRLAAEKRKSEGERCSDRRESPDRHATGGTARKIG
jgi:hypothetical protein